MKKIVTLALSFFMVANVATLDASRVRAVPAFSRIRQIVNTRTKRTLSLPLGIGTYWAGGELVKLGFATLPVLPIGAVAKAAAPSLLARAALRAGSATMIGAGLTLGALGIVIAAQAFKKPNNENK